jgi:hypothetical protein
LNDITLSALDMPFITCVQSIGHRLERLADRPPANSHA